MSKHYVGEVGTIVTLDTGVVLTDATALKIKVLKPDQTEVEWTGAISGTTEIQYTLKAGDFDQVGVYSMQSYVESANGKWSGETVQFTVYNEYE